MILFCLKLAAKRQAQETDSVLSPELSPFCLKAGSIRRSSSRRRRSHRTLSEATAEEAAEDIDPIDEPMVQHLLDSSWCCYQKLLQLIPLCLHSLLCPPCQPTLCWPHSPLTPSVPGEEVRSASSALSGSAKTQRRILGMTSTAFMETPSEAALVQVQHPGRGGQAAYGATALRCSPLASQ